VLSNTRLSVFFGLMIFASIALPTAQHGLLSISSFEKLSIDIHRKTLGLTERSDDDDDDDSFCLTSLLISVMMSDSRHCSIGLRLTSQIYVTFCHLWQINIVVVVLLF